MASGYGDPNRCEIASFRRIRTHSDPRRPDEDDSQCSRVPFKISFRRSAYVAFSEPLPVPCAGVADSIVSVPLSFFKLF
jgi:hypothetical protein